MENNDRKHIYFKDIFVGLLVLTLILSLGACGVTSYFMKESSGESVDWQDEETADNVMGVFVGDEIDEKEEYTIEKAESIINGSDDKVTSAGQAYNSVSEVYVAVADSVVEITTETVQTSIWMGQYVSKGAGSGVIIDEEGFIVTNNHVIEGASNITVRLTDGSEYQATLIGRDSAADLAIIKIDPSGKKLTKAMLGCSADLVVGEDVVALGNPLGSLGGTLTTGIISATERNIMIDGEPMVLLQTNAAINPGNSGGGLFNMAGQLIGVVNAKAAGDDVEGLGFAIPIDFAHKVIEDLINYGYVRGVVDHGLIMLDVTEQNLPTAYRNYGITNVGVVILDSQVSEELKYGDTIISVNGEKIGSAAEVELIVKACSVGDDISVSVMRNGKVVDVVLTLKEKIPDSVTFD